MGSLFELRGKLSVEKATTVQFVGLAVLIGIWQAICSMGYVSQSILPSPIAVVSSYKELYFDDALLMNAAHSIKLNFLGYLEAVAICLPLGFIIGLFPLFREMFNKPLDSMRFVPITAATGVFIAWFGIDDNMKIQFLACGITVYLLPVVVQAVQEVDDTYVQTIQTLSNKRWDAIRKVFMPAVFSAVSTQIIVLVAISWTYITIAELVNRSGGVGALAFVSSRQSRIDKVFAIMFSIIIIGYIQDITLRMLDKLIFPHKYINK